VSQGEQDRVLVFLDEVDRNGDLGRLVGAMLERDHAVTVALGPESGAGGTMNGSTLTAIGKRNPSFDHVRLRRRTDLWHVPADATRRGLDYLRYLESEPKDTDANREAARRQAPRLLRAVLVLPPFRWRFGRRMLASVMERLEGAMPLPGVVKRLVQDQDPDVVVVSAHAALGSSEFEFVRVARATRTPSVLVLTSDGPTHATRIRDEPTLAVVADQERVNEAVQTLGFPRHRLQAVGSEDANGARGLAVEASVEAIDGAAIAKEVDPPPGRVLRPILWLFTPFLFLLLLLMHPRTTSRDVVKAMRRRRRDAHRRRVAKRRSRARQEAETRKASARPAKQHRDAQADAPSERKAARAQAKRAKRDRRESAKQHRREQRRAAKAAADARSEDGGAAA
jgi:F0F1-type ATP synthase membrane subunit b/b'